MNKLKKLIQEEVRQALLNENMGYPDMVERLEYIKKAMAYTKKAMAIAEGYGAKDAALEEAFKILQIEAEAIEQIALDV